MSLDAIIVGTGMGGGAAGYVLARAGLRVLFLERGLARSGWDPSFSRDYAEHFVATERLARAEVYRRSGRADYRVNNWIPVLGGGEGGGTAVYGAGLFRFHPDDLSTWPGMSYRELAPYYERADLMFGPRGTPDPLAKDVRPLRAPEPTSPYAQELMLFLEARGLHPFRTPVGYDARRDCARCFGHFCANACKRTASDVFLAPARATGHAEVMYGAKVTELVIEGRRVVGVRCETSDGPRELRARAVFLGLGALATPTLLLRSQSERFPAGIGNERGLVGRNLMRHLIDFYYVKTPSSAAAAGHLIEVSLTDFYCDGKRSWGLINAGPGLMSADIIAADLADRFGSHPWIKRVIRAVVRAVLRRRTDQRVLVSPIIEDSPSRTNRVRPDSTFDDIKIDYAITPSDRRKLRASRRHLKRLFAPLDVRLLKVAEDSSFLAHACGTCRMDADPTSGVVDPTGRVFGTENLYVTDASIFPTSGGANPSLTIAASAMKLAETYVERHRAA